MSRQLPLLRSGRALVAITHQDRLKRAAQLWAEAVNDAVYDSRTDRTAGLCPGYGFFDDELLRARDDAAEATVRIVEYFVETHDDRGVLAAAQAVIRYARLVMQRSAPPQRAD